MERLAGKLANLCIRVAENSEHRSSYHALRIAFDYLTRLDIREWLDRSGVGSNEYGEAVVSAAGCLGIAHPPPEVVLGDKAYLLKLWRTAKRTPQEEKDLQRLAGKYGESTISLDNACRARLEELRTTQATLGFLDPEDLRELEELAAKYPEQA